MSSGCVINLLEDSRYIDRLVSILVSMKGQRKLQYVQWLKSIGLEVQYQ